MPTLAAPPTPLLPRSTAEADIERLNKDSEVAPHVQDDFDIQAGLPGWLGGVGR